MCSIEKDSINRCEGVVIGADDDVCQTGAAAERGIPDISDVAGDGEGADESRAVGERVVPNVGDAVGDG